MAPPLRQAHRLSKTHHSQGLSRRASPRREKPASSAGGATDNYTTPADNRAATAAREAGTSSKGFRRPATVSVLHIPPGGSGECRVTAGVAWFDSFWHSESIVTVLPTTRQVCGLLRYQLVPSPTGGKLTETRSGLWHNRLGKVHDSPRPAERDDRCEGSAT
jgi:hypothetical protein